MKKSKIKVISLVMLICIIMSINGLAVFAKTPETYVNCNFSTSGEVWDWVYDTYDRSIKTIETDPLTDNKYIKFQYTDKEGAAPAYTTDMYPSSGAYSSLNIRGEIVMSFDIFFGNGSGSVYLKERKPGVDKIVLRIGTKEGRRLIFGTASDTGYLYNKNGDYFEVQDKWYNIQIIANITTDASVAKQSIYVTDKLTGELETKVENIALYKEAEMCNVISTSTSQYMYLDNLIVDDAITSKINIVGNPYPRYNQSNTYTSRSLTKAGVPLFSSRPIIWSLAQPITGVSINATSGVLSVAYNSPLCPVIIKAQSANGEYQAEQQYLVEIEK